MARWAPESACVASASALSLLSFGVLVVLHALSLRALQVLSPDFSDAAAVQRFDAVRRHAPFLTWICRSYERPAGNDASWHHVLPDS